MLALTRRREIGIKSTAQPRAVVAAAVRAVVVAAAVSVLAACTPDPLVITRPVYIDRVQQVVEPIPAELLQPHPIAEGLPSQCPSIAAQRRAELEACNADKAAIRAIAGEKGQGDE